MHDFGEPPVSVPGQGRRNTLGLVVQGQGGKSPPSWTPRSEFDDPGSEHHPEQKPADEHQADVVEGIRQRVLRSTDFTKKFKFYQPVIKVYYYLLQSLNVEHTLSKSGIRTDPSHFCPFSFNHLFSKHFKKMNSNRHKFLFL